MGDRCGATEVSPALSKPRLVNHHLFAIQELREAVETLQGDAIRRAAAERLRLCLEPELEDDIATAVQRLKQVRLHA